MIEATNKTEILERFYNGGLEFSIISIFSCFAILLLIILNKSLRSLTYNFLCFVFISELIGNIGHICEYKKYGGNLCQKGSYYLIPFSDLFTMLLFCFFSYCSVELIKKSNRLIKKKERLFFLLSFIIALVYASIIFVVLILLEDKNRGFYYYDESKPNYIIFIHIGILFCMNCFIFYNTYIVIQFMKEKQKTDKINAWKIAKLIKLLFRFPLICFLYLVFYIISLPLSYKFENLKITYIFQLFAVSFFNLRGFLLFLNTIKTNKIEILIKRIFEVNIKHRLLLHFDLFSKKGIKKDKDIQKDKNDDEEAN